MSVAEEYVQTGCVMIPLPHELFYLNLEEEGEKCYSDIDSGYSVSNESTISLVSNPEKTSYLAIKFGGNTDFFQLPKKTCPWTMENECASSSEDTMSEDEKPMHQIFYEGDTLIRIEEPIEDLEVGLEELEYYKADLSTPPRFKPSQTSVTESPSISFDEETVEGEASEDSGDAVWRDIPRHPQEHILQDKLDLSLRKIRSVVNNDANILKAWHEYYLWQQRAIDMDDSNVGWATYSDRPKDSSVIWNDAKAEELRREWLNYIRSQKTKTRKIEQNIFINTCVLLAIKQFIFDYFYESFQYTLVRFSYRYHHYLITQPINDVWIVPKGIKSTIKRPKVKKPKKEKKPKVKPPKKEKKSSSGKSKDKPNKQSKSSKSSKTEKKEKKEKRKPPTDEEKAEIARLKKEKQLIDEQFRIAEENRRFMLPLANAATDEFFEDIFANWEKIDKSQKKKGKKEKG